MQRSKGARREREIVAKLNALGIKAERVPLSGAMAFRNTEKTDVDFYPFGENQPPWVSEVKARKDGSGFKVIEDWLGDADALFLIRDRAEPLAVMTFTRLGELLMSLKGKPPIRVTPAILAAMQEAAE